MSAPTIAPARPRPGDDFRIIMVTANLLPDEIVAGRRLRQLQRRIVLAFAVLLVVLISGYAVSWWQTGTAQTELSDQQTRTVSLDNQLKTYQPLLDAQAKSTRIEQALSTLMTGDLQWRDLVTELRSAARGGLTVTGVTGNVYTVDQPSVPGAGLELLNQSGLPVIGTVNVTGSAPNKNNVAAYVERLAKLPGLAAPLPASVTGEGNALTFSVDVLLTSDALGGRFAAKTSAANGGN